MSIVVRTRGFIGGLLADGEGDNKKRCLPSSGFVNGIGVTTEKRKKSVARVSEKNVKTLKGKVVFILIGVGNVKAKGVDKKREALFQEDIRGNVSSLVKDRLF